MKQLKYLIQIKKHKIKIYELYIAFALENLVNSNNPKLKKATFKIAPYACFPGSGFAYVYFDRGDIKLELPPEAKFFGFTKEKITPRKAANLIAKSHSKFEHELYNLTKKLLILAKTVREPNARKS